MNNERSKKNKETCKTSLHMIVTVKYSCCWFKKATVLVKTAKATLAMLLALLFKHACSVQNEESFAIFLAHFCLSPCKQSK